MSRRDRRTVHFRSLLLLALLWVVIAEGRPDVLWVGLFAIPLAMLLQTRLPRFGPAPSPPRLARLPGFVVFFLRRSLQGGFDVAWRALHPRLPIDPALLSYPYRLPPGAGELFLATVSLLPGTLSARVEGELLRVHALNAARAEAAVTEAERRVAALFDLWPDGVR